MHKPSSSVAILEHELSEIRLILERKTGVLLDTATESLTAVVGEFMESRHLTSAEELLARLRSSDPECETLAGRLLDGNTRFFRYPAAFESLSKTALPDLQQGDDRGEEASQDEAAPAGPWGSPGEHPSGDKPFLPPQPPIELGGQAAGPIIPGPWGPRK